MIGSTTNFEVRNAEVEESLKSIGETIGRVVPKGYGFTLFLFNTGEGGGMFYISNAVREDMLKALQEFMDKEATNARDRQ